MTSKLSSLNELKFQKFNEKTSHSHHLLPARCTSENWNRDDLIRILHDKFSIKCVIQYYPLHRYSLFRNLGYGEANVPETEPTLSVTKFPLITPPVGVTVTAWF